MTTPAIHRKRVKFLRGAAEISLAPVVFGGLSIITMRLTITWEMRGSKRASHQAQTDAPQNASLSTLIGADIDRWLDGLMDTLSERVCRHTGHQRFSGVDADTSAEGKNRNLPTPAKLYSPTAALLARLQMHVCIYYIFLVFVCEYSIILL
jgi:hypothetical protein